MKKNIVFKHQLFCYSIILLLSFFPLRGLAQSAWTLEQCIRYAYENNIQLKQQMLDVERAENDFLQSKLNLLPNFSISSNFSSSRGKVLDQNTFTVSEGVTVNSLSGGISSNVTLFRGLQQKNIIDRDMYSLLASYQNVEKLKNDLSINITLYFLQIIHAQEQLTIAENQLKLTQMQIERTRQLVKAGSLPEGSLYELQSQVAYEDLQIVTALGRLEFARLNLAQLLDLGTAANFQVVSPDFSNITISGPTTSVLDLFMTAYSVMPQVKAAEYHLKSAEKQLSIARGYRSPTLSLSGGYNTRYSSSAKIYNSNFEALNYPLGRQLKDGISSYIGLGLSVPVFNGWQVQTGIKNAALNLQNNWYQLQIIHNNLYKEIQQAHTDAVESYKRYIASTRAVVSIEEAFRYTEHRYEAGLVNFVDYTTAKTRLATAQSDLVQAKFEYIFKTKVLDFYRKIR